MEQVSKNIKNLVSNFSFPTISVLGSHSALDVCQGAKQYGLKNIVICQKGREKVYTTHYKSKKSIFGDLGCVDKTIILDSFKQIIEKKVIDELVDQQSIFVPNRSFSVYVGYDNIEKNFPIPIFGNRYLLRAEERNVPYNQQFLLKKANIPIPKVYSSPEEIDSLVIVKVLEEKRPYERAFFFASSAKEYHEKSNKLIEQKIISKKNLENALIEEFVIGAQFNFNFFYSPLENRLELLGIDTRRQTNLDGLLRLPYLQQKDLNLRVTTIEVGHISCTIRESLLEQVFDLGEKFIKTTKEYYPDGIIGPFALQGAVVEQDGSEKIYIFDVSFRIPGSPGTAYTPYTKYLFGQNLSVGQRIALEIKKAAKNDELEKIVT
ncbi:MAG: formate--phosphoribosylaminoimidazolecarboxamide ligase family protein [Candidatus Anstonellaceae archaeon]